ncbi:permease family-domain-containing protein [Desarmillaria tabescens]|uniref:Permease family-domain-containing protein n=1 Tax=Armillaria tabescens TaxID=1929756 RepID=A0AA39JJJ6_ARMTA|nr:permease family-domain-containing protein [Desarmillaria tabescens]KAK0443947.1 permease family-domain-containing protein [Desarmillaria tabescens]
MSSDILTTSQPKPIAQPEANSRGAALKERASRIAKKFTTRDGWLGDYDYKWLCMPTLPYARQKRAPPFYALEQDLPLILAISSGFQHSLAMLAGLITPPIIFASALSLDDELSAYMISASLIGCGILSLVQMSRIPLFGGHYLGTGLISVVGTSFATLSTASAIFDAMYNDGTCPSTTAADGTVTRLACPDAYGKVLGTSLICSFLEMFMSFVPARKLKHIFPPIVTGTVIVMIGASLIGDSGIPNWGGGSNDCMDRPTSGSFQLCPNIAAPRPLPWGSAEFIGLGFLSFSTIMLTELFGSPFLKNISIVVGLAVGCIVSGAAGYIDGSSITSAPAITFLWVHTFKIGVYPPAILPMLAVYVSIAMEAIGDITASAEVSRVAVDGLEFDSRIQGGLLSDGIGGFFSALFTVTPLSIFAQNNGVIAITRCANRSAGRWCCFFLILFGVLGKISGVFLAIPNPVLGGVTTFLFASVATSGIRVLAYNAFTRRDRFVLAAALSFGFGDLLVPTIFEHLFDGVDNPNKGLQGLFDSITIILSTPFLAAGIVAVILNLTLPQEFDEHEREHDDDDDVELAEVESQKHKSG